MSICAACGHDNPSGARFCGSCGSPLEQPSQSRATMQPDEKPARRRRRPAAFIGVGVLVVVGIALLALSMVRIVGAGEVGVVHTFGVVDPEPRPPGLVLEAPWASLESMNVRTQQFTMGSAAEEASVLAGDTIRTLTSEGLSVGLDLTVWFALEQASAPVVFSTIGPNYAGIIIGPAIRNAVRDVVAQYTFEQLIGVLGDEIGDEILQQLRRDLEPRGILVEKVLLREIDIGNRVIPRE